MITATILTLNAQTHLKKVLDSLTSFDDVVLLDSGSTDQTKSIADSYPNVRFFPHHFDGFGPAHNKAATLAKHDWILSIDADEIPTAELINEINALKLEANTVYDIPFHNIFRERWIKWCGWHPESHIRLYNKTKTSFTEAYVHERILSDDMKVQRLNHPIHHYSYQSLSDFLIKMERYSTLFARQNVGKKRVSVWTAVNHSVAAFVKSYILKRGFIGGFEGFVISSYNAHTAFYKYLKLYELNASYSHVSQSRRREACELPADSHAPS